jgi:hypothetical protein
VWRDSDVQNLTRDSYEFELSSLVAENATSSNATKGTSNSLWSNSALPTTIAEPRGDQANLSFLRFPLSVDQLTLSAQAASFSMGSKKVTFTKVVVFVMLVLLCIGLALGCTEKTGEEASSPDFSRSALGYRTDQHDFKRPASLVIEGHDGDWAKKYRGAERTQKQALDLLYLCNIIPPEEFLTAKVREDHIDECIWIANAMLKQKTIREWLEGGDYAREFFNSCVTALYEARSDIKDSQRYESPQCRRERNSPEGAFPVQDRVPLERLGSSRLLNRCREIMATTRRESNPMASPRAPMSQDMR